MGEGGRVEEEKDPSGRCVAPRFRGIAPVQRVNKRHAGGSHQLFPQKGADGKPLRTFIGRARGVATASRLALPKRASASLGEVPMKAHALKWLSTRVWELAHYSRKDPIESF